MFGHKNLKATYLCGTLPLACTYRNVVVFFFKTFVLALGLSKYSYHCNKTDFCRAPGLESSSRLVAASICILVILGRGSQR